MKKMLPIILIILLFVAVAVFGWWMYQWQYKKADSILENWAQKNSYTILAKEDANPSGTGPGDRYADNKQVMYRITVEDKAGNKKSGLAKIGSEKTGTLSDEIIVEWDQ